MTFREELFDQLKDLDFDDRDAVIETMQIMARELLRNHDICMIYEEKLQELMSAKEFREWSTKVAKELFQKDIDEMPDGEFKQFCIDHFDEITER